MLRAPADALGRLPLVGAAASLAYRRRFMRARGKLRLFYGIYPDFASAARAIPPGRDEGYDNAASSTRVIDEWLGVYPNDYPVMFWLARLLREGSHVLDWGGNVGLKYFAFARYLRYPAGLRWDVTEVPAIVALGREIAEREGATALRFTTELDALGEADILLAAGVLHFIADPFARLAAAPRLPPHLVLNKVPVQDQPDAFTLHNMGTALMPYHLFNRGDFVASIERLGYRLVDEWRSPDVACEVPFHPAYAVPAYSGFYFTKDAPRC
ncbi:MAG: TIGR04325 family methyltransferase [Vulcanimicrobiaceae bacterium]